MQYWKEMTCSITFSCKYQMKNRTITCLISMYGNPKTQKLTTKEHKIQMEIVQFPQTKLSHQVICKQKEFMQIQLQAIQIHIIKFCNHATAYLSPCFTKKLLNKETLPFHLLACEYVQVCVRENSLSCTCQEAFHSYHSGVEGTSY